MFKASPKLLKGMKPVISPEERKQMRQRTQISLMWLGIVSIIMLFSGLTSGYIVRKGEGDWISFEMPSSFFASTGLILASSATLYWAFQSIKAGKKKAAINGLLLTILLGLGFALLQWLGWGELVQSGLFFSGGSPSSSFFYVLTGLHLAHLAGGILSLFYVLWRTLKGAYSPEDYLGFKVSAIYWHFLDILWLYLFLFLLFIR